jgi:hypothetical protein
MGKEDAMKPSVSITTLVLIAIMLTSCLYSHVTLTYGTELSRTELGHKKGMSSMYSVLWLFAWGDWGCSFIEKWRYHQADTHGLGSVFRFIRHLLSAYHDRLRRLTGAPVMNTIDRMSVVLALSLLLTGCYNGVLFNSRLYSHTMEPLTLTGIRRKWSEACWRLTAISATYSSRLASSGEPTGLEMLQVSMGSETFTMPIFKYCAYSSAYGRRISCMSMGNSARLFLPVFLDPHAAQSFSVSSFQ